MAPAPPETLVGTNRPAARETLSDRTFRAGKWRLASAMLQGGLQFGVGVLLARLLPPEDFGLVALALIAVGLAGMVADLGLGPAVIQRRPLTERHIRVAFTGSVLLGTGVAVLLSLVAPLVALAVRNAAVTPVLRLLALVFVLAGVGTTARGLLQRRLDFRRLFVVDVTSYSIGYAGVAFTMALLGYGVWSLVWGTLVQGFLGAVLALTLSRHPVRPLLARAELQHLLGFGAGISLNLVVNYFARYGDNFIIGRWLGSYMLGLYARAYNLMLLPQTYIASAASSVLFPAFAEARTDPVRLGRAYLMAIQLTALITAPVMAGMIVAAPHMIVGLYGAPWAGAALPLQILSAAGLFRAVYHLAGALTQASGHVYAETRRQVGYAVLVVVGALLGLRWGVAGVAVGVSIAIGYMYLAMAQLSLRILGQNWSSFFAAQLPGVVLAVFVGSVAVVVRVLLERQNVSSLLNFIAILVASILALPLGVYLLPASMRPVELFSKFGTVFARLPSPLRAAVHRALHLSTYEEAL